MFTYNASVAHRTLILAKWIEFSVFVLFYFENDHGCDSELSLPGEMDREWEREREMYNWKTLEM